jgi:Domain of unknown function (DUF1707)
VTDPSPAGRGRPDPAPGALRASDADRERVAEVLREAAGLGRITVDELDERLDRVYAAKTYAELEPVTRDLPEHAPPGPGLVTGPPGPARVAAAFPSDRIGGTPGHRVLLAVIGAASRRGRWVVPRRHLSVAMMGRVHLDLRDAYFAEPQITLRALALMGGVRVTVPDGVDVDVSGLALMGAVRRKASGPGLPGGPRVRIVGLALMGEVNVRRKGTVLPGRRLAGKTRRPGIAGDRPGRGTIGA